jgi:hypothetical protein
MCTRSHLYLSLSLSRTLAPSSRARARSLSLSSAPSALAQQQPDMRGSGYHQAIGAFFLVFFMFIFRPILLSPAAATYRKVLYLHIGNYYLHRKLLFA